MLENEVEKKLAKKVKALGGRAYKFVSPGNAGVPDRLVVMPGGKVGFAEIKRPDRNSKKITRKTNGIFKKFKLLHNDN